jgi:SGNH domain (fused to AT3 domains)
VRHSSYRRLAWALAVAAALVASWASAAGSAVTTPRCFGASARAPRHPCDNPALRHSVVPTPSDALITPNLPCGRIETVGRGTVFDGALGVCELAEPVATAVATVGLVGDSHAMNWFAPLDVAGRALGWRVVAMARSHCPFSRATILLPRGDRAGCLRWRRRVVSWFDRHPEITTVFLAQYTSRSVPVRARPGESQQAAQVAGYRSAWAALPRSVAHIVVIRDNPQIGRGTFGCIRHAMTLHEDAGRACARPRSVALRPDPAAIAVAQLHSRRVRLADFTRLMCSARLCYPVVGGALVNKDATHLTRVFATSLAPFLLRRVERLVPDWRS